MELTIEQKLQVKSQCLNIAYGSVAEVDNPAYHSNSTVRNGKSINKITEAAQKLYEWVVKD